MILLRRQTHACLAVGIVAASLAALIFLLPTLAFAAAPLPTIPATSSPVSLDASASIIGQDQPFRFGAKIVLPHKTEYLQARLRLTRPAGTLVYQKTFVKQNVTSSSVGFLFERETADLGLVPGTYPVELSMRWVESGQVTETVVSSSLLVYGKTRPALPVSLVVRISPQPMSEADGTFSLDPAQFTRAREDVRKLSEYVLSDASAHLTICLSPMMLDEWRRIATGYRFLSAEGEITAAATDPVPLQYASALQTLKDAVATGRLEVLSLGFSDPDLVQLSRAGLLGDLGMQYRRGIAAAGRTVTVVSSGTAPAWGAVTDSSVSALARSGLRFAVVDGRLIKPGRVVVPVLLGRDRRIKIIPSDSALSASVEQSSTSDSLRLAFRRYMTGSTPSPVTLLVEVGPGGAYAEQVIDLGHRLSSSPWTNMQLVSETASQNAQGIARVRALKGSTPPRGYWKAVRAARTAADGLNFALFGRSRLVEPVLKGSLVAESSVWEGFDRSWRPAGRGLSYATAANRDADEVFSKIRLTARPVALAGASGRVPVTINNDNGFPVRVTLHASPDEFAQPERLATTLVLQRGENFVEIPVKLVNSLAGKIRITVSANDEEIATSEVALRASYLDKLAIVGAIVLALGILLAFIIRRVRSMEGSGRS